MRDFGRILPQFWIGETGKKLRGYPEAQVVALYLLTGPSANAIGLYYLPMPTLCHETGTPFKGASKALRRVSEGGLARYDEVKEAVWVPEMARIQIAPSLKPHDNRIPWIVREAETQSKSPFLMHFYDKYKERFNLPEEGPWKGLPTPFEGPSDPLRSQEQDQESDQDQDKTSSVDWSDGFESFWSIYPQRRRKEKPTAELAFRAARKKADLETILTALRADVRSEDWEKEDGKFVPYPAKWLKRQRWLDVRETAEPIAIKRENRILAPEEQGPSAEELFGKVIK